MKSAEDILTYINHRINFMLMRPLMYSDSAIGLESMALGEMDIYRFGKGLAALNTNNEWVKFAHQTIGYKGAFTVASFLKNNNNLDEHWTQLTDLLREFYKNKLKA